MKLYLPCLSLFVCVPSLTAQVTSVNGQTGAVSLTAPQVGAQPQPDPTNNAYISFQIGTSSNPCPLSGTGAVTFCITQAATQGGPNVLSMSVSGASYVPAAIGLPASAVPNLSSVNGFIYSNGQGSYSQATTASFKSVLDPVYQSATIPPNQTYNINQDAVVQYNNAYSGKAMVLNLTAQSNYVYMHLFGLSNNSWYFGMNNTTNFDIGNDSTKIFSLTSGAPSNSLVVAVDGSVQHPNGTSGPQTTAPSVGTSCSSNGVRYEYTDGRTRVCLNGTLQLPPTN